MNLSPPHLVDAPSPLPHAPAVALSAALAQAANPATPPRQLQELTLCHEPAVDQLLALNPNTPAKVLNSLLCKYPLAALENPIFTYRVFSEARSLHWFLPPAVQVHLYIALCDAGRRAEIDVHIPPSERQNWLCWTHHREIARELSAADYLRFVHCLVADSSADVRAETWRLFPFRDPDLEASLLPEVERIVQDPGCEAEALALLKNSLLPEAFCQAFMRGRRSLVLALARCDRLAPRFREQLVNDPHENVAAAALASLRSCSLALTRRLYDTGKPMIRLALAQAPGAGPSQMRPVLAADPDIEVRRAAAVYLTTRIQSYSGPAIARSLELLARDVSPEIRVLVAGDRRLSLETVRLLARDPQPSIRQVVLASHPRRVDGDCGLLAEANPQIRREAALTILDPFNLYGRGPALSERIAMDVLPEIRALAAAYRHRSAAAVDLLALDDDSQVQRALARNAVVWRVLSPLSLAWAGLRPRTKHPLHKLSRSRRPAFRALAATVSKCGRRHLARLAADANWFVRCCAARNARVPVEWLERLAADSHPWVSRVAAEELATRRPTARQADAQP